nr:hypothetical protein [Picobirnavirus sp.]
MTANQIAYQKALEDARHNRAQEILQSEKQIEEKRHNEKQEIASILSGTGALARGASSIAKLFI